MIQKQKISTQGGKKDEISSSSHASSTRDSSYPNETHVNSAEGEHLLDEKSKSKPRRRRDKRKPEPNLEGKNSAHQVLGPLINTVVVRKLTHWNLETFQIRTIWRLYFNCPPASEVSRELANLTERKNQHTPVRIWCQRICLSVCPSVKTLIPIISGLAEQNGLTKAVRAIFVSLFFFKNSLSPCERSE